MMEACSGHAGMRHAHSSDVRYGAHYAVGIAWLWATILVVLGRM